MARAGGAVSLRRHSTGQPRCRPAVHRGRCAVRRTDSIRLGSQFHLLSLTRLHPAADEPPRHSRRLLGPLARWGGERAGTLEAAAADSL